MDYLIKDAVSLLGSWVAVEFLILNLFGFRKWNGASVCPASILCILGPDLEDTLGKRLGIDLGLL